MCTQSGIIEWRRIYSSFVATEINNNIKYKLTFFSNLFIFFFVYVFMKKCFLCSLLEQLINAHSSRNIVYSKSHLLRSSLRVSMKQYNIDRSKFREKKITKTEKNEIILCCVTSRNVVRVERSIEKVVLRNVKQQHCSRVGMKHICLFDCIATCNNSLLRRSEITQTKRGLSLGVTRIWISFFFYLSFFFLNLREIKSDTIQL